MRLFLFDLETTGLDIKHDRILEHGYILWDTEHKKPLGMSSAFWFDESYPTEWPAAQAVNGITRSHIEEAGFSPKHILNWLESFLEKHSVDYLVAHNGASFDVPFMKEEINRSGMLCPRFCSTPLIDTRHDLPFLVTPRSRHLGHLAYDHRVFHDPNDKHSALFDCQLMLGILKNYDIDEIVAHSRSPNTIVQAIVDREHKDLAKFNGYRWDATTYLWKRSIKVSELEKEMQRCKTIGFEIKELK